MSPEFYWVAVVATTIVSASRLTRLATWDEFPPAKYLRESFADWTDKTPRRQGWQILVYCGYCFSFWATALVVVWGDLSGVYDGETAWGTEPGVAGVVWWLVNGILAASYLAAILMVHDGDDGDEDGEPV